MALFNKIPFSNYCVLSQFQFRLQMERDKGEVFFNTSTNPAIASQI